MSNGCISVFCGTFIDVTPSVDDQTKIIAVVPNLNPYTQYKFRVIGVNGLGAGLPSQESCELTIIIFIQ